MTEDELKKGNELHDKIQRLQDYKAKLGDLSMEYGMVSDVNYKDFVNDIVEEIIAARVEFLSIGRYDL